MDADHCRGTLTPLAARGEAVPPSRGLRAAAAWVGQRPDPSPTAGHRAGHMSSRIPVTLEPPSVLTGERPMPDTAIPRLAGSNNTLLLAQTIRSSRRMRNAISRQSARASCSRRCYCARVRLRLGCFYAGDRFTKPGRNAAHVSLRLLQDIRARAGAWMALRTETNEAAVQRPPMREAGLAELVALSRRNG